MMKRFIVTFLAFVLLILSSFGAEKGKSLNGRPFFRNFTAAEYDGHNRNFDVECDSTGKVFIANFEGLMIWNGVSWQMIHTPGISRITSLLNSGDGRLWFGGCNVFGYLDNGNNPYYIVSDADSTSSIGEVSDIFVEDGYVSFRAEGNCYRIEQDQVVRCGELEGHGGISTVWDGLFINDLLEIKELGIRALASGSAGVIVTDISDNVIFSLDSEGGLCGNSVNALKYDGKGSLWGVTDNGVFQIYVHSVYSRYDENDGLIGRVNAILNSHGRLYVGTIQGLFVLEDDGKFHKVEEIGLACWNLKTDASGDVLAATANGVFRCTPEVKQITSSHTLCIFPQSDGSMLTGEVDGIYHHGTGADTCILSAPNICKIEADEDGGLWAINYYLDTYNKAPDASHFVPAQNGTISLLLDYTDPNGTKWMPDKEGKGLVSDNMDQNEQEWLSPLGDFSIDAMHIVDNAAWIGGSFGLMRIQLDQMKLLKPYSPKLYLRSFIQNGDEVSFSVSMDKSDPMSHPKFSYRLHDDDRWSRWNESPEMSFSNLSSGKYQLMVRCMDSYGAIAETDPVLFRIDAPLYLRWFAFVFYVLLVSAITFLFMRYRLYKAAKEQERLEAIVVERTSELKEAQNKLLSQEREATVGKLTKGLIDRILNPMNYINNFTKLTKGLVLDLLQDINDDKDKISPDIYDDMADVTDIMQQNLDKIEQHGLATTRILKAMEELLKEHAGALETTQMLPFCRKILEVAGNYAKDKIEQYGIEMILDCKDDSITADINRVNMEKAIGSMLANSIYAIVRKEQKKTGEGEKPVIRLTLSRPDSGNGCLLSLYDSGIGMEESIMDKIFDPFFTTKPTSEAPGVGLYLSRQIVQYANGTIQAESVKDEYSEFRIILP